MKTRTYFEVTVLLTNGKKVIAQDHTSASMSAACFAASARNDVRGVLDITEIVSTATPSGARIARKVAKS